MPTCHMMSACGHPSLAGMNIYLVKKDPYLTMEDLYLEEHHWLKNLGVYLWESL